MSQKENSKNKLVCSKCGETKFYYAYNTAYCVMIYNGSAGGQDYYCCANCGQEMIVERPAVYYGPSEPQEVFLPNESTSTLNETTIISDTIIISNIKWINQ